MAFVPSRREGKKRRTKERIYRTALELFQQLGYEATTVDAIARRADVAKGTFFNYFRRKEDILVHMGEERMEAVREELARRLSAAMGVRAQLELIFEVLARENAREKPLVRLVLFEALKRRVEMEEEGGGVRDELKEHFASLLALGRERGEVRPEVDPARGGEMLEALYFHTLFHWLRPGSEYDLEAELIRKTRLLFRGFEAEGGPPGRPPGDEEGRR